MRLSGSFLHRSEASTSPRFFKEHSENNFICDRYVCQQALPKKGGPVKVGRSGGIRTRGLLDPNQARYQASPHPDSLCIIPEIPESVKRQILVFRPSEAQITQRTAAFAWLCAAISFWTKCLRGIIRQCFYLPSFSAFLAALALALASWAFLASARAFSAAVSLVDIAHLAISMRT